MHNLLRSTIIISALLIASLHVYMLAVAFAALLTYTILILRRDYTYNQKLKHYDAVEEALSIINK